MLLARAILLRAPDGLLVLNVHAGPLPLFASSNLTSVELVGNQLTGKPQFLCLRCLILVHI